MSVKLGFSLQRSYPLPFPQVISLLRNAGFHAVSPAWTNDEDLAVIVNAARENDLYLQSLHAPNHTEVLWSTDTAISAPMTQTVLHCLDLCRQYGIPTLVMHSWSGFDYVFQKDALYFGNFDRVVSYAGKQGIKIALENLEGAEFLEALMSRYADVPHIGYCWDSGHENCYPYALDFLKAFGHRLIMTHINDNFGLRSPDGHLTGQDDLHFLPWDGSIDWNKTIFRLCSAKQQEILNFELKTHSKSTKQEDLLYGDMPLEHYIAEAAKRAKKLTKMYDETI